MAPLAAPSGSNNRILLTWDEKLLHCVQEQLRDADLHSPLVWLSQRVVEKVNEPKLCDLIALAPSDWDAIAFNLIWITRKVYSGSVYPSELWDALKLCRSFLHNASRSLCPLIREYSESMRHIVEATALAVHCILRNGELLQSHGIAKLESMSPKARSAVFAVRALTLRACHYGFWPWLLDERRSPYLDYQLFAAHAYLLYPNEGYWNTLYGSGLPSKHKDKEQYLREGYANREMPFTFIEYAAYLASQNGSSSIDFATLICELAVQNWPTDAFVNMAYTTIYLRTACQKRLSGRLASRCLRQARRVAPQSIMLIRLGAELKTCLRASRACPLTTLSEEELPDSVELVQETQALASSELIQADKCNCVCCGTCVFLTYRAYGTIIVETDTPQSCHKSRTWGMSRKTAGAVV